MSNAHAQARNTSVNEQHPNLYSQMEEIKYFCDEQYTMDLAHLCAQLFCCYYICEKDVNKDNFWWKLEKSYRRRMIQLTLLKPSDIVKLNFMSLK